MYEEYSKQALPSKIYRELLGSATCVFNSNNQFIIENILQIDDDNYNWYELIDLTSGSEKLKEAIKETITKNSNTDIATLFGKLVSKRNRIIHSFQITEKDEQILRTKSKKHEQYNITEEFLLEFIKDNESLSTLLHNFRGH